MFNQGTTLPSLRSVAAGGFWPWGLLLMFSEQMTKTSNPKHGCVVGTRASVHCQAAGLLTDDAPDSSSSPPHAFRPRPAHPTTEHVWVGGSGGGLFTAATLLNMWLTHWEWLWGIRLKDELFIRTWRAGLIGQSGGKSTPPPSPKQHYKFDGDTSHCSYLFF